MKKTEVKNLLLLSLLYGKTEKKFFSIVNISVSRHCRYFIRRSVKTHRSIFRSQSDLTATYYNRQSFELAASKTQAL
jgi:hypothetical protein